VSALDAHAREWLGVPWRHLGRTRAGVDCIGLVLLSCAAAGVTIPDPAPYAREPQGALLAREILHHADRAPIEPGAVLLFRMGVYAGHVGIASLHPDRGELSVIHAYAPHRVVVEQVLDEPLRKALVGAYRLRA
jgi:cell wall-associated NlpC family hydrolase